MTDPTFSRPGAVDLTALSQQAAAPSGASYVTPITEAGFEQLLGQSMTHPVIVEFYSPQDPGGAQLTTMLSELVNAAAGKFLLARVNVDAEPRLTQGLGVTAVPTVVALIAGQLAPLFQGTRERAEVQALLDQVAQLAVANGVTGRAQPIGGPADGAQPAADPRFDKADAALAAGDYARAVAELEALLKETPNDPAVIAGRAQAALLQRSTEFDPAAVVQGAAERPRDVEVQLQAADLDIIQGLHEQAFDRLLGLAAEVDADERETVRVRLLELFEVVGRTDPDVLRARRRLATVLF